MSGKSLRKADNAKDQLILIQHQINNPLSVILGNVQFLLLSREQLDEKLIKRLELIEKSSFKINQENKKLTDIIELISKK